MSRLAQPLSIMKKVVITLSLLISVAAVAGVGFLWWKHPDPKTWLSLLKDPETAAADDVKAAVTAVGKVAVLPEGEPTLATVTDKTKLANQPFFQSAENGDQVLIYTDAKKAFLYRPSTKQIVEIAPLTIQDSQSSALETTPKASASPTPAASVSPVATVPVSLYNGTTVAGLTSRFETRMRAAAPESQVTARQNAAKNDYATSFVVEPSTPVQQSAARSLATKLGLSVLPLPEGEIAPANSIMIILGADAAGE